MSAAAARTGSARKSSGVTIEESISKIMAVTGNVVKDNHEDECRHTGGSLMCSWKFSPTFGLSILHSMPAASRILGLPMPDNSSS